MEQLLAGLDVVAGIESQKPVVGLVDLPLRIARRGMVVEHAAPHHDEIVIRIVGAGEEIIIQPVGFLQIIIIDDDIGTALKRLAGGNILKGKDPKPVYRRLPDRDLHDITARPCCKRMGQDVLNCQRPVSRFVAAMAPHRGDGARAWR
jgi:hypothetical protein